MRIDQTRVAIRERTWLDNLDLALQFIRTNFRGCAWSAIIGITPFALVNYLIVRTVFADNLSDDLEFDMIFLGTLLVLIEAPLATAPLTLLLGQVVFVERAEPKKIARDLAGSLPQLILFQLIVRTLLVIPVLTLILPYGAWPYLNEIILLERNPLTARQGQLSTRKRSSVLHSSGGGDHLFRAAGSAFLAAILVTALWTSGRILLNMLFGLELGMAGQILLLQVTLWVAAAFFTVARFLCYLDQRIRNEGWEIELALRAERQRLLRQAG